MPRIVSSSLYEIVYSPHLYYCTLRKTLQLSWLTFPCVYISVRCQLPDQTQQFKSSILVFFIYCDMFRLSRSANMRQMSDTQKVSLPLCPYFISDFYPMMADLDSRNMLHFVMKFYFTKYVWLCLVGQLAPYTKTCYSLLVQGDTKKTRILKTSTKIEEIQEKKLLTEIEPLQLAF